MLGKVIGNDPPTSIDGLKIIQRDGKLFIDEPTSKFHEWSLVDYLIKIVAPGIDKTKHEKKEKSCKPPLCRPFPKKKILTVSEKEEIDDLQFLTLSLLEICKNKIEHLDIKLDSSLNPNGDLYRTVKYLSVIIQSAKTIQRVVGYKINGFGL